MPRALHTPPLQQRTWLQPGGTTLRGAGACPEQSERWRVPQINAFLWMDVAPTTPPAGVSQRSIFPTRCLRCESHVVFCYGPFYRPFPGLEN